jgi:hypothetical protein
MTAPADSKVNNLCAPRPGDTFDMTIPADKGGGPYPPDSKAGDELKFRKTCKLNMENPSCSSSFALIWSAVNEGNLALKAPLEAVCNDTKRIATECTDAAKGQKCAADIYKTLLGNCAPRSAPLKRPWVN